MNWHVFLIRNGSTKKGGVLLNKKIKNMVIPFVLGIGTVAYFAGPSLIPTASAHTYNPMGKNPIIFAGDMTTSTIHYYEAKGDKVMDGPLTSDEAKLLNDTISANWNALTKNQQDDIIANDEFTDADPFGIDTAKDLYKVGTNTKIPNPGYDQPRGYGSCTAATAYSTLEPTSNPTICSTTSPGEPTDPDNPGKGENGNPPSSGNGGQDNGNGNNGDTGNGKGNQGKGYDSIT